MVRNMMLGNATSLYRQSSLTSLLYPERNINYECQYPDTITTENYHDMYDREAVAKRVVHLFPDKCWSEFPMIVENEKPEDTAFEKDWKALVKTKRVFHYLKRIDILSGIGEFGVLLLGISDGKDLSEPVEGINEVTGELSGSPNYELLYLKPFNQRVVEIKTKERNSASPRYGMPKLYDIKFEEMESNQVETSQTKTVHWTRIIHVADNREVSDTLGVPRMKSVYNRLIDIRKISSGSAEMFWKGGFPGMAFETYPDMETELDTDAIEEQMEDYMNGLQRYLALENVQTKMLSPAIADPKGHMEMQIALIAIDLGVPKRMLMGSEEAKLASEQDTQNFNTTISGRRENYLDPLVIRPLVDRLMMLGIIPMVEEYLVVWNDLDAPSEEDKANVAKIKTEAISKYVMGGVADFIAPEEYLDIFLGLTSEEINVIKLGSVLWENLGEDPEEDDDSNTSTPNDDDNQE